MFSFSPCSVHAPNSPSPVPILLHVGPAFSLHPGTHTALQRVASRAAFHGESADCMPACTWAAGQTGLLTTDHEESSNEGRIVQDKACHRPRLGLFGQQQQHHDDWPCLEARGPSALGSQWSGGRPALPESDAEGGNDGDARWPAEGGKRRSASPAAVSVNPGPFQCEMRRPRLRTRCVVTARACFKPRGRRQPAPSHDQLVCSGMAAGMQGKGAQCGDP